VLCHTKYHAVTSRLNLFHAGDLDPWNCKTS
jgi:hypothetical protein